LVCVDDTPYYHVSCRCVRRAFLCGVDRFSGKSYEHRRQWVEQRARVLASIFSIELCAYAVMSNHYHLVLRLVPDEARHWSDDEVLERWTALHKGTLLVQRYRDGELLSDVELQSLRSTTAIYRRRLADLSWFMKCLNEPIARRANREDGCSGHFWEARFHSQALRSERALIAAMAYVDLNPIRAGIATAPETSEYTSIRHRVSEGGHKSVLTDAMSEAFSSGEILHADIAIRPLMPFAPGASRSTGATLPIKQSEYLELVDLTGRIAINGKRGNIDTALAPILKRLKVSAKAWIDASSAFRQHYCGGDLREAS
jgi:REP element-mobilizing transposase RayT